MIAPRINLRSDTVTVPTPEMLEAMARAEVGDDQSRTDPTVLELERTGADMLGKEDGLFVASGTMGNLVSLLSISQRGDSIVADSMAHVMLFEAGGYAALGGCTITAVETDGVMTAELARAALTPADMHYLKPAILWAENTQNRRGGVPWGPEVMRGLVDLAAEHGFKLHIDGARIFNAAVALDVPARELAAGADTVQICLTKGLGAPFGSLIVGSAELIARARRVRQMVGGGMRQAGVMAAAGLEALRHGPARLAGDHRRARTLGAIMEDIDGVTLEHPVRTNLVFLRIDTSRIDAVSFAEYARRRGVEIGMPRFGAIIRLATHHQISDGDIEEAADVLADAAEAARATVASGA